MGGEAGRGPVGKWSFVGAKGQRIRQDLSVSWGRAGEALCDEVSYCESANQLLTGGV